MDLDRVVLVFLRRTCNQGGLDRSDVVLAELYVCAPLLRIGDSGSVGNTDNVVRVLAALHTQRYAKVGVSEDVVVDNPGRALSGKDHVDAQSSPDRGDAHQ